MSSGSSRVKCSGEIEKNKSSNFARSTEELFLWNGTYDRPIERRCKENLTIDGVSFLRAIIRSRSFDIKCRLEIGL